jgi:hypothetical protein
MTIDQPAGRQPHSWLLYTHPPVSAMLLGRFVLAVFFVSILAPLVACFP